MDIWLTVLGGYFLSCWGWSGSFTSQSKILNHLGEGTDGI